MVAGKIKLQNCKKCRNKESQGTEICGMHVLCKCGKDVHGFEKKIKYKCKSCRNIYCADHIVEGECVMLISE